MSMSKTFIGGTVCREFELGWEFESEAPAAEEMLDWVVCSSEQFCFQMCLEGSGTFSRWRQRVPDSWCSDSESLGLKVDLCRLMPLIIMIIITICITDNMNKYQDHQEIITYLLFTFILGTGKRKLISPFGVFTFQEIKIIFTFFKFATQIRVGGTATKWGILYPVQTDSGFLMKTFVLPSWYWSESILTLRNKWLIPCFTSPFHFGQVSDVRIAYLHITTGKRLINISLMTLSMKVWLCYICALWPLRMWQFTSENNSP